MPALPRAACGPKQTLVKPDFVPEIMRRTDPMSLRWLVSAQLDKADFPPICHHFYLSPIREPSLSHRLVERLDEPISDGAGFHSLDVRPQNFKEPLLMIPHDDIGKSGLLKRASRFIRRRPVEGKTATLQKCHHLC